jgi:uncharacterized protein YycO
MKHLRLMHRRFTIASLLCIIPLTLSSCTSNEPRLQPGDIVFQSLDSPQCAAIRLATGSEYTHCGLVLQSEDGVMLVAEAIQPVRIIPVDEWIAQGIEQSYLVMRPATSGMINELMLAEMLDEARSQQGKDYDFLFNWSDDQMYCSEFVWKVYDRAADIQLTELRELGSFDLTNPVVQEILAERYGEDIPLQEPVVAPSDLIESPLLMKVYEGQ